MESSLRYLDGQLELTSSFSTGEPVKGAVVRLLQADGTPGKELGHIDAKGRLEVTLPELGDGLVDLQVDGGPGHRDYLTLPLQQGRVNLDEVVMGPGSRTALNWAVAPALVGVVGLMVRVRSLRQR
ncbi:putative conserved membrane protein [Synechococcus sp. BIOS-U3-1]|nr:putative conserved membrane protein [Synechococcus sp. BIOS-U3-1]